MQKSWALSISQIVRFIDLDAMGHVNNAHYLTYLEEGRVAFFRHFWGELASPSMTECFPFIIAHIDIDFLAPISLQQKVETKICVSHIGDKSFRFQYEISADQSPACRAESVQVGYDYATHRSAPLSEEFKSRLRAMGQY